ncbi:MAG: hypothetical protein AB7L09_22020 [Nitrospira sp.]
MTIIEPLPSDDDDPADVAASDALMMDPDTRRVLGLMALRDESNPDND